MLNRYRCKYPAEVVLLIRDFYKEIISDGAVENQLHAFSLVLKKREYRGMEGVEFEHLLDSNGKLTFKNLLRNMYPNATARDITSMILLAFPPNVKERAVKPITSKERSELIELFKLWDTDNNLIITLDEFTRGMKDLSLSKAELIGIMQQLDKDKDGVLSLDEFVEGMHQSYF